MLVCGLCIAYGYRKCKKHKKSSDKYLDNGVDTNGGIMNSPNSKMSMEMRLKYAYGKGKNGKNIQIGVPVDQSFDENDGTGKKRGGGGCGNPDCKGDHVCAGCHDHLGDGGHGVGNRGWIDSEDG